MGAFVVVKNEEGQAVTEYILLMAVILMIYLMVTTTMAKIGLAKKLTTPLTTSFAAIYQYGHPLAKGYQNGGPMYHPRVEGGDNNFRIFFNPETK
jgi:uncharacterized protein (UPF0333 family)